MDNLDALGYLKCSIAHTGYLAILLVLHILQYVQYSHMGSIARTGYSIADTGTSTLEHTSRHPHVLGNNFVPYVFQKLRLAQIRMYSHGRALRNLGSEAHAPFLSVS